MITIVFTYRNRDITIVNKCLDSLAKQTRNDFKVFCVDYGSSVFFATELEKTIAKFPFVDLISCPVEGQLWNKARAINIVLRQVTTEYFFVGDIDMIFREDFVEKLYELQSKEQAIYFKVGYLNREESKKNAAFDSIQISHYSTSEATGMTLYPTNMLLQINGYDEFYHGWGAEDTDVHVRLQNKGCPVHFYDNEILMLHQWHPKTYRSKDSTEPFHSSLEKINYQYIQFSQKNAVVKANISNSWGVLPVLHEYQRLKTPARNIVVFNEKTEIEAFVNGNIFQFCEEVVSFEIKIHPQYPSLKNKIKKIVGKKSYSFYTFSDVNDLLLEVIMQRFRNNPYTYSYNKRNNSINFTLLFY